MLLVVAGSFFLEPNIIGSYFSDSVWQSVLFSNIVIFTGLRVVFFSAVYGAMIEIASGEKDVFSLDQLRRNVKEYWLLYALLSMIPVLAHFVFFALFPDRPIPFIAAGVFSDLVIFYIFAQTAVTCKYLQPMAIPRRAVRLGPGDAAVIAGIVLSASIAAHTLNLFPYSARTMNALMYKTIFFLFKYLHFFGFLFFCLCILRSYPQVKQRFSYKEEIIFVCPPAGGVWFSFISFAMRFCPPVFVLLRALTPRRYHVREYNQVMWNDHYYAAGKLVAITCFTSNAAEAYRIAKGFRERGSKVVMGGPHVMFLPREALEFCDSVVIGEAEPVWEEILNDYEQGSLKDVYYGQADDEYYRVSHQALLTLPPKLVSKYIETGRGCKFHCDFCVIPALCGGKIRHKPVAEVLELLRIAGKEARSFSFVDNNLYSVPKYAKELFRAIKPLKMKWSASCSIDIARDDEALALAKEAGCNMILVGYEIFSGSDEKKKAGKFSMADDYLALTRKIKKAGIKIKAHFILGLGGFSFRNVRRLWTFCFSLFPTLTIITILTPLPGSKFFHDIIQEGRLINLNWSRYNMAHLVFKQGNIPPGLFDIIYPLCYSTFLATSLYGIFLLAVLILF